MKVLGWINSLSNEKGVLIVQFNAVISQLFSKILAGILPTKDKLPGVMNSQDELTAPVSECINPCPRDPYHPLSGRAHVPAP